MSRYDGVPDHQDPAIIFPPHMYTAYASLLYIMEQINFKLSESNNQAQHLTSGNSKIYGIG